MLTKMNLRLNFLKIVTLLFRGNRSKGRELRPSKTLIKPASKRLCSTGGKQKLSSRFCQDLGES